MLRARQLASAVALTAMVLSLTAMRPRANQARALLHHAPLTTAQAVLWRLGDPSPAPARLLPEANLELLNVVRDERVDLTPFDRRGVPDPASFEAIRHLFRSGYGSEVAIDPRLIEVLMVLQRRFEGHQLVLISGHREASRRTSKKSYHVRGMAADIAVRGVKTRALYEAALELGVRGVGRYRHFVHVDVRDDVPFKWVGDAGARGPRWRGRRR